MARKIFVSVLVVLATLVIVPSVLAALRSLSDFGRRSHTGPWSVAAGPRLCRWMPTDYESAQP